MRASQNKKITKIIAKVILGRLSEQEKKELHAWLEENDNNKKLFAKIKNSENFKRWVRIQESNHQIAWEFINNTINKKERRVIIHKTIGIAASIIFPLLIIVGIYFLNSKKSYEQAETIQQVDEIIPGTSKAILVLNDGSSLVLDNMNQSEIRETDGTIIQKAESKLDYTTKKGEIKAEHALLNTIRIPRGAEYNLVLSDSTRVFMNAMSELRFPVRFSGEVREVELTGEAYFEVSPSDKPFIVKTRQVNIEVMGTSFNINAYENTQKIITTLVEGKVKVVDTGKSGSGYVLQPEEQAVINLGDGMVKIEKVDVTLFTSWKDGEFIFYDSPLSDIMTILSRWYSVDVFYKNPVIKDLRFSGSLDRYGNIDQILDIIEATNKVKLEVDGSNIIFSERN